MTMAIEEAIVVEARHKYHTDPVFHARVKMAEGLLIRAAGRSLDDHERHLVVRAAMLGLFMAEVNPMTGEIQT